MTLSIIIPTLNEAKNIGFLLQFLQKNSDASLVEIIVADASSSDGTLDIAAPFQVKTLTAPKGRALQMNAAAAIAKGEILYFVHADTIPPNDFFQKIVESVTKNKQIGCFRFKFDSNSFLLKINSFCTRFPFLWCRGGDQTLFVTKAFFQQLQGFDEKYSIMEEYDFIRRAAKIHSFSIICEDVLVSARKYEENGYFRVQIANLVAFNMFRFGCSQSAILNTYKRILNVKGLSWGV